MDAIFKKLNYKDQKQIFIYNAPESFQPNLKDMSSFSEINEEVKSPKEIEFVIAFVTLQKEVDRLIRLIDPNLKGDAVIWFVYPKGSSKKYKCDFNRDTGWKEFGHYDLEPVRMVAIDEDWSALRFRKVEYIKTLTRNSEMTLSEKGKEKSSNK